jgi:hypothetical protein
METPENLFDERERAGQWEIGDSSWLFATTDIDVSDD